MDQPRADRRLAAILAADVAGYSRLMEADEDGTLAQLKAHRRALIDPKIKEHRGQLVKLTGDGALVEFASVVDAVRCAVEVQRGMGERNAGVPQAKRIEYRIGINLGDVIHDQKDILGDGVNIAARLEGLAEPGGISRDWVGRRKRRRRSPSCRGSTPTFRWSAHSAITVRSRTRRRSRSVQYMEGARRAGLNECATAAELQKYPKMTHLALCDARRTTH
jgi:class 3 adenylate cyclase